MPCHFPPLSSLFPLPREFIYLHSPPPSSRRQKKQEEPKRSRQAVASQRKKKMESSNCMGLMAVVAVSGSIALVALQVHRRLASDFIKKLESEIGRERNRPRKKVRFAPDVIEPSSNNEEYRRRKRTALPPPTNR